MIIYYLTNTTPFSQNVTTVFGAHVKQLNFERKEKTGKVGKLEAEKLGNFLPCSLIMFRVARRPRSAA